MAINVRGILNNVFVENRKSAERINIADQLSLAWLIERVKRLLFMRLLISLHISCFFNGSDGDQILLLTEIGDLIHDAEIIPEIVREIMFAGIDKKMFVIFRKPINRITVIMPDNFTQL